LVDYKKTKMKTLNILYITLIFALTLTHFSCNDSNKSLPNEPINTPTDADSVDMCSGFPKIDDSTGKIVYWEEDLTGFLKDQNYFVNQIPKDYTGHLKLCDKKHMRFYLSCKDGKADGLSYEFYCQGGYNEMYFKDSLAEGTWVRYDKDKQISSVKNYKGGQLNGECLYLNKYKQPWIKENYLNGQKHGMFEENYPSGKIKKQEEYKNNLLKYRKEYYENGRLKSFSEYINGRNSRWVEYDENGKKMVDNVEKPPLNIQIHRP